MIGQTLGNYRIIEQIGMGGMATVYKAYDPDTDRYVAIKILPQHFSHDPKFRERFEREAKAIARLEHLHILPIFAYGEDHGVAYMAMRYLKAGTLTDRIRQGPMPLPEASRLIGQVASALDHAHRHGILHRDIKPGNVLLDNTGNAFLTDFGIAKMVESSSDLTRGDILGTPAYMSPEQCQGVKDLTPASDIYSLGIVLYEMVTGRTPFQAETPIALIHMQLNDPLPLPRKVRPELPAAAENVILKALAKKPEARFATCTAMAAAFAQAAGDKPTASLPVKAHPEEATQIYSPSSTTTIEKKSPAMGWLLPVAALALVALVLCGGLGAWLLLRGASSGATESAATTAAQRQVSLGTEPEPTATNPPETVPNEAPAASPTPFTPLLAERYVQPCDWAGNGNGICIYNVLDDSEPIRVLAADENFDYSDAPTWDPTGTKLAFSARRQDADLNSLFIIDINTQEITPLPGQGNDIFPAWSPDGEWLAFHSSGNLKKMRLDGTGVQELLAEANEGCAYLPQWSPDSRRIVVSALETCEWEFPMERDIYVLAANGDNLEWLATTEHTAECSNFEVAFSPNGQHVAYEDGECQPYLLDITNPDLQSSLDDFPYHWNSGHFPRWPDAADYVPPEPDDSNAIPPSEALRVDPCHWLYDGEPGVCVSNLDGEVVAEILKDEVTDAENFSGYGWDPTGQQVALITAPESLDEATLYIANVSDDTFEAYPLRGYVTDPAWSPDGEWIALQVDGGLSLIRPDGTDLTPLTETDACIVWPEWSPYGDYLITTFQTKPANCDYSFPMTMDVRAVSFDGAEQLTLATNTFADDSCLEMWNVGFSPDGEHVAYVNGDCETEQVGFYNPKDFKPLDEFPLSWTSQIFPQWAAISQ